MTGNQQRYKMTSIETSCAVSKHTPGIKLTQEERAKKVVNHKHGLCCSCDNGLDCYTQFIYYDHPTDLYALGMCIPCYRYYRSTGTDFDFDKWLSS